MKKKMFRTVTALSVAAVVMMSTGCAPRHHVRVKAPAPEKSIKITKFVVGKNIHDFLGDYFNINKTYYIRVIYQTNTDKAFTQKFESTMKEHFQVQHKLVDSPVKADNIITLYPQIRKSRGGRTTSYSMVFDGYLTSKVKNSKVPDEALANHVSSDYNVTKMSLKTMGLAKLVVAKKPFKFALDVTYTNADNQQEVNDVVSQIALDKLLNVLGLREIK